MKLWEVPLTKIYEGWRVREAVTEEHYIEIHKMIYNLRIVRSYKDGSGYDRGFCYQIESATDFVGVVLAAMEWDGADDTEPVGYFKRVL